MSIPDRLRTVPGCSRSRPVQGGGEVVGVGLPADLPVGDDVEPGLLLRPDRRPAWRRPGPPAGTPAERATARAARTRGGNWWPSRSRSISQSGCGRLPTIIVGSGGSGAGIGFSRSDVRRSRSAGRASSTCGRDCHSAHSALTSPAVRSSSGQVLLRAAARSRSPPRGRSRSSRPAPRPCRPAPGRRPSGRPAPAPRRPAPSRGPGPRSARRAAARRSGRCRAAARPGWARRARPRARRGRARRAAPCPATSARRGTGCRCRPAAR